MKRVAFAVALTVGAAAAVAPLASAAGGSSNETSASAVGPPKQGLCVDLSPMGMPSICIGRLL